MQAVSIAAFGPNLSSNLGQTPAANRQPATQGIGTCNTGRSDCERYRVVPPGQQPTVDCIAVASVAGSHLPRAPSSAPTADEQLPARRD